MKVILPLRKNEAGREVAVIYWKQRSMEVEINEKEMVVFERDIMSEVEIKLKLLRRAERWIVVDMEIEERRL